ncbi:MAG: methionyl-tRNA formyltransferase, partial [Planctomycetes bacterium]|nr:methionyl-tRNA formyltransferase [Planctomycetota bacterium]
MMKIVFFGSGEFAVPSLQALCAAGYELTLVGTQPDRPAGRGGQIRQTPVCLAAQDLGLAIFQPEKLRGNAEVVQTLQAEAPDLCVVVAYGHLIPDELLQIPRHGFINAHASLLPKYRGAAPVPHAILNGETETGVTIFKLDADWDTGPVYGKIKTPISSDDTSGSVLERLSLLAGELMVTIVGQIDQGTLTPLPQTSEGACKAPKFTREDGMIDWSMSAAAIDCLVRAFQPWPEAFTTFAGKRGRLMQLHILKAVPEPARVQEAEGKHPGEIIE